MRAGVTTTHSILSSSCVPPPFLSFFDRNHTQVWQQKGFSIPASSADVSGAVTDGTEAGGRDTRKTEGAQKDGKDDEKKRSMPEAQRDTGAKKCKTAGVDKEQVDESPVMS